MTQPRRLVVLRHGASEWSRLNLFTGWIDVDLSSEGEQQAARAAREIAQAGFRPTALHTSRQQRARRTGEIMLRAFGVEAGHVTIRPAWQLNERHYGALQGQNRAEVRRRFGAEAYERWRRSFDGRPPPERRESHAPLDVDVARHFGDAAPTGESLADVARRVVPYVRSVIAADLSPGATVLVVAHSNSLRALIMHVDQLSPDDVQQLNVPVCAPLVYEVDNACRSHGPIDPATRVSGRFINEEYARASIAEVRDQGLERQETDTKGL